MDSLTQITLGAAVGEAVLGKKLGNKAIWIGGFAGTVPDLDVIITPFLDDVSMLTIHRGISHSIFFAILAAPIFAWIFQRFYPKEDATFRRWSWMFFLAFLTHSLLDTCTVYGTQLFMPFSDYRAGFNNIFLIDFAYTLPMLIALILLARKHKDSDIRRKLNWTGIIISHIYMLWTFGAKAMVNTKVEEAFAKQNIEYKRYLTAPTPFNTILWYTVAETEDGYYMGHYSLLDKREDIALDFMPRNEALIEDVKDAYSVDRVLWFSKGYYVAREVNGEKVIYDIKFGRMNVRPGQQNRFIFPFIVKETNDAINIVSDRKPPQENLGRMFGELWERIKGL